MPCKISCSISLIFIVGMIYFYNATSENQIVKKYKSTLSKPLQKIYDKICMERRNISIQGYILGLILSFGIIYYDLKIKKTRLNNISLICIVVATCFLTNYFYYILHPKTDWMLNHLDTKKENKAWLQMYRTMQFNYHLGLVLGILAVGLLAFAFR